MRVLVADDHTLFRDGIVSLLQAAGFTVVGQVSTGRAAVEETLRLQPDLVLMDISMPQMNGLEALQRIQEKMPGVQVVMLTVSEDDTDLIKAMKAGARGYLLKDLNARDFLEMLKGLEYGEIAITRKTVARLLDGFLEPSSFNSEPSEILTSREVEILELVAQGLPNKTLAQRLGISENTIKYHVRKILRKLRAQNRVEAVTHAIRMGLIKPDQST